MADRFPSIEEFDEGTGGSGDLLDGNGEESDFLARERQTLGADADFFTTDQDNIPSVTVGHQNDDDLMGGSNSSHTNGHDQAMSNFQSSFPAIDTRNDRVAPGGTITGTGSRPFTPQPSYALEDEPEVLKEWRERRAEQIHKREDAAEKRKTETVKAAQESVDEFYENYNNKKEKGINQTRKEAEEFLKNREDTTAGGTSWQRIAKLVDIKPGAAKGGATLTGKERFREMLGSLVKDEDAPGAKGY